MVGGYRAPPILHNLPLWKPKSIIQNSHSSSNINKESSPPPIILKGQQQKLVPNRRRFLLLSLPLSAFLLLPCSHADAASADTVYELYDPLTNSERDASALISQRVSQAVDLLEKGRELQARGDFNGALIYFSKVIESYKDFAFSEYARVGRALALYEVGDRDQAIAEMEDVSISLKGYPEVHAALAAALYADKHAPLLAENQFTIATLLDPHFTDISYVRDTKHWPPSLISSLRNFITLS